MRQLFWRINLKLKSLIYMRQVDSNKRMLLFFLPQELREMVNLPGTRPEMIQADFNGIEEALKGEVMGWLPLS